MATSIDKSVNWRKSADTPDYQVAARRVDTFVQPPRNIRGEQVAEALGQAAGVVSKVGKQQAQQKRERQIAALDTTAAQIREDLKSKKIQHLTESQDYSQLPEVLRIKIAQSIGKTDAEALEIQVLDAYNANPNIALTDDGLEGFLAGYQVTVDGENGFDIHRQASTADALEGLKSRLRGDAVGKRSAHNLALVSETFSKGVNGIFLDSGLTPKARWEAVSALDLGDTGLDNVTKNKIILDLSVEYAKATGDTAILQAHNIPTKFKNPVNDLVRLKIGQELEETDRVNKKWAWQVRDEEQRLVTENDFNAGLDTLIAFQQGEGKNLDLNSVKDPNARLQLKNVMSAGITDSNTSSLNATKLDIMTQNFINNVTPYTDSQGTSLTPTRENMTNLILSYKGVNPNDKKVIINKLTGYFDLGNIFSGNTHRNAFTPALAILQTVEQSMLKSGLDGSAVFIAEARTQLESTYAQLYREAMADGTMHFSDTQHITTELNKFARTLVSPEAIATLGSGDDVGNLMTTLGFGKTEGGTPTVDTSGDPTPTVETPEELEAEKIEEQDKALQEKLEVIFHTQNEPALPNLHKLSKSYQEAEKALEGVPEEKREELIKQYAEEALEAIAVEMDYNKFGGWSGKRDNKQLETLVKEIGKDPKSAFTKDVREILDNLERNTKELDRLNNKSGG